MKEQNPANLADEVREAVTEIPLVASTQIVPQQYCTKISSIRIPRPYFFKRCPVCKEKKLSGRHEKVCRKQHRFKWFLRDLI